MTQSEVWMSTNSWGLIKIAKQSVKSKLQPWHKDIPATGISFFKSLSATALLNDCNLTAGDHECSG